MRETTLAKKHRLIDEIYDVCRSIDDVYFDHTIETENFIDTITAKALHIYCSNKSLLQLKKFAEGALKVAKESKGEKRCI